MSLWKYFEILQMVKKHDEVKKKFEVLSNIYLSSCLSVCMYESSERPGRWTNPHQIWYGDLTLQGQGHRLCFGPRGGPRGGPPGSGGP